MSSPRKPVKDVALDANTFGDTPAAIYLVELLNNRNDHVLARKTAKVLAEGRELISDLARAHLEFDALTTKTLARLIPMLSEYFHNKSVTPLRIIDSHIADLAINVLEGSLKTWKNRVQKARRTERSTARNLPPGASKQWIPAKPLSNEITGEVLRNRSKKYLQRKGKPDTLY